MGLNQQEYESILYDMNARYREKVLEHRTFVTLGRYAEFLSITNELERAKEYYAMALTKGPNVVTDNRRAIASVYAGYAYFLEHVEKRPDAAAEMYVQTFKWFAQEPFGLGNYAMFCVSVEKDLEKATMWFDRAIERYPTQSVVGAKYAALIQPRDPDKAEELFALALSVSPENPDVLGLVAVHCHGIKKDYGEAERLYQRAIKHDPFHPTNLEHIFRAYYPNNTFGTMVGNYGLFLSDIRQNPVKAQELYLRSIASNPAHVNSLYNLAVLCHFELQDHDQAEKWYHRALDVVQDTIHTSLVYNYAVFLEEIRQDVPQAQRYYLKALKQNPKDVAIVSDVAAFYERCSKDHHHVSVLDGNHHHINEAKFYYEMANDLSPDVPRILIALVRVSLQEQTLDQTTNSSRVDIRRWIYRLMCMSFISPSDDLAQFHQILANVPSAHRLFEDCYRQKRDIRVLVGHGRFCELVECNYKRAEKYYAAALAQDGTNVKAVAVYAHFLAHVRHDRKAAQLLVQKATLRQHDVEALAELRALGL